MCSEALCEKDNVLSKSYVDFLNIWDNCNNAQGRNQEFSTAGEVCNFLGIKAL